MKNLLLFTALVLSSSQAFGETLQQKAVRIAKNFASESSSVYNSHCGTPGAATSYTLDAFSNETGITSFFIPLNTRESNYECSPDYGVDIVFDARGDLLQARLVNN